MTAPFSEFERFALCSAVPFLELPALDNPSDKELWRRCVEISYHLIRENEGEEGLVTILSQLGAFQVEGEKRWSINQQPVR